MNQVATRPLSRHLRFEAGESDGRTLAGLAVPFNETTRIANPFEGEFDEQFARGAFKRSLSRQTPKLQFDHGTHPLIGSLPVGEIRNLTETDRGLEVEATMFEAELFAPLREAIASNAIDGMSIRFRPLAINVEQGDGVELRTVTEAELIELGPVVFPAYAGTEVDLRSFDLTNENDRHRLAEALLSGVRTDHGSRGQPLGSGPDSAPELPATSTAPAPVVASVSSGVPDIQSHKDFYQRWISKS